MKTILALTAFVLTTVSAAAQAPPPPPVQPRFLLERAVRSMGGDAALRNAGVVIQDFNQATFGIGQEETPGSPARATFNVGRIVTDWANNRRVLTQEIRPLTGGIQRQRRVTAGGIGLIETDGRQAPDAPGTVAGVERAMRLSPEKLILSALENPAAVSPIPVKAVRGLTSDGVRYAAGPDTLELFFDRGNGLLVSSEVLTDDPILGDRRTATIYTRWQDAGGIKLPRQVDVEANGRLQSHTVFTGVTSGAPAGAAIFSIPDSISSRAQRAPAAQAPLSVAVTSVAPGIWHVTGSTHHSLVVEQANNLIVIEGPQSTARGRAVLDTLKSRFPNKPVAMVVATHHHWDHASGLRAFLAAGVPVVTHSRNVDFVRQIGAARKTVAPDGLPRAGRVPQVTAVTDSLVIGAGDGRVVLYLTRTAHVEGMLMAYVPSARVLFNSDLVGPGQAPNRVGAQEVVAAVKARGITVDKVAGGHGTGTAAWADVERMAQ